MRLEAQGFLSRDKTNKKESKEKTQAKTKKSGSLNKVKPEKEKFVEKKSDVNFVKHNSFTLSTVLREAELLTFPCKRNFFSCPIWIFVVPLLFGSQTREVDTSCLIRCRV